MTTTSAGTATTGARVSGVKKPNDKHLMLFSGRAYPELADEVSSLMGVDLVPTRALNYANSEIYVRFEESVRGSDAFLFPLHYALFIFLFLFLSLLSLYKAHFGQRLRNALKRLLYSLFHVW